MAERRFVHGSARFRELFAGTLSAAVGVGVVAATGADSVMGWLVGIALGCIGVATVMRSRRLGLFIADDMVVLRRFFFTKVYELEKCCLVIDDDQEQLSVYKFAILQATGSESQSVNQISWTGRLATSPNLISLLREIEAAGLEVDRKPASTR